MIKWDPITREENSWLLDFMREMWKWKDSSAIVTDLLQDKKDQEMFNRIYHKLAHEEWKFEQERRSCDDRTH